MKTLNLSIAISLLLLSSATNAIAANPPKNDIICADTQADDSSSASPCAQFKAADDTLNREYHLVYDHEHNRHQLRLMEAAWINYRDAVCDWEVGPSASADARVLCLALKTRQHTAHLKNVAHCGEDPYDCDVKSESAHE